MLALECVTFKLLQADRSGGVRMRASKMTGGATPAANAWFYGAALLTCSMVIAELIRLDTSVMLLGTISVVLAWLATFE